MKARQDPDASPVQWPDHVIHGEGSPQRQTDGTILNHCTQGEKAQRTDWVGLLSRAYYAQVKRVWMPLHAHKDSTSHPRHTWASARIFVGAGAQLRGCPKTSR